MTKTTSALDMFRPIVAVGPVIAWLWLADYILKAGHVYWAVAVIMLSPVIMLSGPFTLSVWDSKRSL